MTAESDKCESIRHRAIGWNPMTLGRTNVGPTEVGRETQADAAGGLRLAFLVSPLRDQDYQCGTVHGARFHIVNLIQ